MSQPVLPTVGADTGVWGAKLNDAITSMSDQVDVVRDRVSKLRIKKFDVAADYGAGAGNRVQDTAAFAEARLDMLAAGRGTLVIPAGSYSVDTLPKFSPMTPGGPLPFGVEGDGPGVSIINHYGTSRAASLTVNNPAFKPDEGSTGSAPWRGFTIDGSNSSGGCSGLQWGDISYPTFSDIDLRRFASGDGMFFTNQYGWCEGVNMVNVRSEYNGTQLRFDVGSGRAVGTITTALATGSSYTAVAVAGGLSESLYQGQEIVIAAALSAIGVHTQSVVVTAAVAQGATSIPVQQFTAGAAFPAGTARVHFGGFGSYDYWSVNSLHIEGLVNQHGLVSEKSRGLGERIDRLGSSYNVKGNFRAGAGNTGVVFWLKGRDRWNDTSWEWTVETGGGQPTHRSVQLDNNDASLGGTGVFSCYGCETAVMEPYQWEFKGTAIVKAPFLSLDPVKFLHTYEPGQTNITRGIRPAGYPTAVVSGQSWRNDTDFDLLVTIPVTFTGSGTASWNVDGYNGLPATAPPQAGGPAGVKVPVTFVHHAHAWARVDVTNGTIGVPWIEYR